MEASGGGFNTRIAQKAENLNFAGESFHGKKVGNTIQTTHPVRRRRVKPKPDYKRFVYTTPTDVCQGNWAFIGNQMEFISHFCLVKSPRWELGGLIFGKSAR